MDFQPAVIRQDFRNVLKSGNGAAVKSSPGTGGEQNHESPKRRKPEKKSI
jgi:hypothetical protein